MILKVSPNYKCCSLSYVLVKSYCEVFSTLIKAILKIKAES